MNEKIRMIEDIDALTTSHSETKPKMVETTIELKPTKEPEATVELKPKDKDATVEIKPTPKVDQTKTVILEASPSAPPLPVPEAPAVSESTLGKPNIQFTKKQSVVETYEVQIRRPGEHV